MPTLPDDAGPRNSMCALLDKFFQALDRQRQLMSAGDEDGADRAFHRVVGLVREMVNAIDHYPQSGDDEQVTGEFLQHITAKSAARRKHSRRPG